MIDRRIALDAWLRTALWTGRDQESENAEPESLDQCAEKDDMGKEN